MTVIGTGRLRRVGSSMNRAFTSEMILRISVLSKFPEASNFPRAFLKSGRSILGVLGKLEGKGE